MSLLSTLPARGQATVTALTAPHASLFYRLKTSQPASRTLPVNQLLSPCPQSPNGIGSPGRGGGAQQNQTSGKSHFHSLSVRVSRRFPGGPQFTFSQMRSQLLEQVSWLNPGDPDTVRGMPRFDRPHRFITAVAHALPFGRGSRFGLESRLLDTILGGRRSRGAFPWRAGGRTARAVPRQRQQPGRLRLLTESRII